MARLNRKGLRKSKDSNDQLDDSLKAYIEAEESENLTGSLTNQLVETIAGTILKRFSKKPKMSYVQALGRVPALKLERQDHQDRIKNEKIFREFIEGYDIEVPDILGYEENFMEFEKIEGTDLNDYINNNPITSEYFGREVGEFLNYVHENNGAITDLRLNNFIVQDGEEMGFLDAEYFVQGASEWEKNMDIITMASSVRQVDTKAYEDFMDGFESQYREIERYEDAISSVTSLGHAGILERDQERLRNATSNL